MGKNKDTLFANPSFLKDHFKGKKKLAGKEEKFKPTSEGLW